MNSHSKFVHSPSFKLISWSIRVVTVALHPIMAAKLVLNPRHVNMSDCFDVDVPEAA